MLEPRATVLVRRIRECTIWGGCFGRHKQRCADLTVNKLELQILIGRNSLFPYAYIGFYRHSLLFFIQAKLTKKLRCYIEEIYILLWYIAHLWWRSRKVEQVLLIRFMKETDSKRYSRQAWCGIRFLEDWINCLEPLPAALEVISSLIVTRNSIAKNSKRSDPVQSYNK